MAYGKGLIVQKRCFLFCSLALRGNLFTSSGKANWGDRNKNKQTNKKQQSKTNQTMGPAFCYSCWRIPQAPFANYTKDPHLVCSRHIWRFPWSELSCQTLNEFQESLSWAAKMGWYQPQKVLGLSSNNWESPGSFGAKPMWDGKEELSTVPPTNIYSCLLCAQPPTHLSTTIWLHSCWMPLQTDSDAGGIFDW